MFEIHEDDLWKSIYIQKRPKIARILPWSVRLRRFTHDYGHLVKINTNKTSLWSVYIYIYIKLAKRKSLLKSIDFTLPIDIAIVVDDILQLNVIMPLCYPWSLWENGKVKWKMHADWPTSNSSDGTDAFSNASAQSVQKHLFTEQ